MSNFVCFKEFCFLNGRIEIKQKNKLTALLGMHIEGTIRRNSTLPLSHGSVDSVSNH